MNVNTAIEDASAFRGFSTLDIGHIVAERERSIGENLARHARIAGVEIDAKSLACVSRRDIVVLAAPVDGITLVDPIDYRNGVDTSFIYLRHSHKSHLMDGYYRVRSVAIRA